MHARIHLCTSTHDLLPPLTGVQERYEDDDGAMHAEAVVEDGLVVGAESELQDNEKSTTALAMERR